MKDSIHSRSHKLHLEHWGSLPPLSLFVMDRFLSIQHLSFHFR